MDHDLLSPEDDARFAGYRTNVDLFIQETLSADVIANSDYVPGTQRIDFYEQLFENASGFRVYDYRRSPNLISQGPYEEALYQRIATSHPGLLVLIGGLGAGKSTGVRHLLSIIDERQQQIAAAHPCSCQPCLRRPIVVDCLDLDRTFNTNECEAEVMMRIRREIYRQLIAEWYGHNNDDADSLSSAQRKVLRRLIIANDIYHWADSETLEFPADLHTQGLELVDDLLNYSPKDWVIPALVNKYASAANALDGPIQAAIANVGLGKRFTALVIGYWLRTCNPTSPNNLIVVDNLDQQPTDHIEQIANHLHDLDIRHRGLRLLLPLRPSSIVPHGFTKNTNYMYHYGANCFDIIYQRLTKYVLTKSRADLLQDVGPSKPFLTTPTPDEMLCFIIVSYIYALVCINGIKGPDGGAEDVRPIVHEDHLFLYRVRFSGAAVEQLAETLGAVVGTCGRYATDQLRRYFDHVYTRHAFLRQIETSGILMGTSPKIGIPFGQIIGAVLGAQGAESGVTGLANLYSATHVRTNAKLPTLSKLRVLAFLSVRGRVRVRDVIAALAQYGMPWEVSIEALNYLHAKNRLLLWFSRNTDLPVDSPDIEQYVVISEHGQAYLSNLVGDFEYVWFCAQQVLAIATSDSMHNFRTRLRDYSQLLADLARIEWKQMTFRHCSSATAWTMPSEDLESGEMLTLYILYSSLERALGGASVAVRKGDTQYVDEVVGVVSAIVDLILTQQEDYEVFYGSNAYLTVYAPKIEKSRKEVERLRENNIFNQPAVRLDELLAVWALPLSGSVGSKVGDRSVDVAGGGKHVYADYVWLEFVRSVPSLHLTKDELHTRASLEASLEPLITRRATICGVLEERFPAYSFVDHEVGLLVEETKVVCDAAARLAAYTRPLLEWLERELAAAEDLRVVLTSQAFFVPDITSLNAMDELKRRANSISTAYVALAQRLGARRTRHLAVRWSV